VSDNRFIRPLKGVSVSVLDSLPERPLSEGESGPVVEAAPLARAEDGVRHLALQVEDTLYEVGYDDEEGWVAIDERTAGDPDDFAALREELHAWASANTS
jgi:hypothetical protein